MSSATVSSQEIQMRLKGAEFAGLDLEALLKAQDIPIQILSNPNLRVSLAKEAALAVSVIEALQDESYGFLEIPMPLGTWEHIFRACLSASTLRQSLTIWASGCNLLGHSVSAEFIEDENGGALTVDCKHRASIDGDPIVDSQLVHLHRYHCWLTRDFLPIEKVELKRKKPAFANAQQHAYYEAPTFYGCQRNSITFSNKSLGIVCDRTNQEFEAWLPDHKFNVLTLERSPNSLEVKLRVWIEQKLRKDDIEISLESAAEYTGLQPHTIRRQLKRQGTSFNQLKEDTRRDIAISALSLDKLTVEDIAYRVGFSDTSTFTRAFKRWTGVAPYAYRKMCNKVGA